MNHIGFNRAILAAPSQYQNLLKRANLELLRRTANYPKAQAAVKKPQAVESTETIPEDSPED